MTHSRRQSARPVLPRRSGACRSALLLLAAAADLRPVHPHPPHHTTPHHTTPHHTARARHQAALHELNQTDFYDFLESSADKLTVVDFYTDWCGPCKLIYPELVKMNEEMAPRVQIVKFNCNKDNKELGKTLGIKVRRRVRGGSWGGGEGRRRGCGRASLQWCLRARLI